MFCPVFNLDSFALRQKIIPPNPHIFNPKPHFPIHYPLKKSPHCYIVSNKFLLWLAHCESNLLIVTKATINVADRHHKNLNYK